MDEFRGHSVRKIGKWMTWRSRSSARSRVEAREERPTPLAARGWTGAFTPTDADAMPASALASVLPAAAPRVSARGAPRSSSRSARRAVRAAASNTVDARFALLFDCDGVIVETGA